MSSTLLPFALKSFSSVISHYTVLEIESLLTE